MVEMWCWSRLKYLDKLAHKVTRTTSLENNHDALKVSGIKVYLLPGCRFHVSRAVIEFQDQLM